MNRYLLDTNVWIEYLRQKNHRLVSRIQGKRPRQVRLCSIALAELVHGARCSADPPYNLKLIDELKNTFGCLPFDDNAAAIFGDVRHKLEVLGMPIGPYDLQIASIALARGLILVTHNVGEFSRVLGLSIEDWQA